MMEPTKAAPKERVPAIRLTSYQADDGREGRVVRCDTEGLTQVPIDHAALHFASMIKMIHHNCRVLEAATGLPIFMEMMLALSLSDPQPIGKERIVLSDRDGAEKTSYETDHGNP